MVEYGPSRAFGVLALTCALALIPSPSYGQDVVPPNARVFTLAGGGSEPARDGVPATDVKLGTGSSGEVPVAALPDGSVATIDARGRPMVITRTGVVRRLPSLPFNDGIAYLIGLTDGSLVATHRIPSGAVYRLPVGATAWSRLAELGGLSPADALSAPGPLSDGGLVVTVGTTVWRVGLDGRTSPWGADLSARDPGEEADSIRKVLGLTDGSLAVVRQTPVGTARRIVVHGPSGQITASVRMPRLNGIPDLTAEAVGLLALPGGGLVRTTWTIDLLTGTGAPRTLGGSRPRYGLGDGGPPGSALFRAASIARLSDGALALGDINPLIGAALRFDLPAAVVDGRLMTVGFDNPEMTTPVIRVIVAGDTRRPLAAFAPDTFTTLGAGRVMIRSAVPGTADVTVQTRGGRIVGRARGRIRRGQTALKLHRRPPRAALRLRLRLTTDAGLRIADRITASTVRTLTTARARAATESATSEEEYVDEGGGYLFDVGRCRRRSRTRLDCQIIDVEAFVGQPRKRECGGVARVEARPDGVRVGKIRGERRCRTLR